MSVIEKISVISGTITKLMNFTLAHAQIKSDFNEYLTAVAGKDVPKSKLNGLIISYIFERRLPVSKKTVTEIYKETFPDIPQEEIEILDALDKSFSSVFEIRRIFGSGFELYNLVNELNYRVTTLAKMNNFRGISPGQFALCRIFELKGEFYLCEISNVISSSNKEEVYKYAIARIIERPEDAYENNKKKYDIIQKSVNEFGKKFTECFGTDEIVTTNHYADNIINIFNAYCEEGEKPGENTIKANIQLPDKLRYFTVSEFKNSYNDFMEKSMEGFSSHIETYDIGIIYDQNAGLFVLPFYKTFCEIFEADDYKNVQGYKDCIKSFLENDKIPASVIKRIAKKYNNFADRINEIFGSSLSFDDILNKYKPDSVNKNIFSSTSVLYASKIFENMMNEVKQKEIHKQKEGINYSKVGRNDKCPCGSGKKYKNCCMPR